jgi:hypothetical protein
MVWGHYEKGKRENQTISTTEQKIKQKDKKNTTGKVQWN